MLFSFVPLLTQRMLLKFTPKKKTKGKEVVYKSAVWQIFEGNTSFFSLKLFNSVYFFKYLAAWRSSKKSRNVKRPKTVADLLLEIGPILSGAGEKNGGKKRREIQY